MRVIDCGQRRVLDYCQIDVADSRRSSGQSCCSTLTFRCQFRSPGRVLILLLCRSHREFLRPSVPR